MKTEIKHRWTGAVLYSGEHATVKDALLAAIAVKADLRRADLSEAYLSEADRGRVLTHLSVRVQGGPEMIFPYGTNAFCQLRRRARRLWRWLPLPGGAE